MSLTDSKSNAKTCLLGGMLVPGAALLQTLAGSCHRSQHWGHSHACRNTQVSSIFSPAAGRIGDIWLGALKGEYEFARSRVKEPGNQSVLRLIWVQDKHPGWMLYGRDRKPWEGEESESEVAGGAVPVRHGIPKGFLEEVDVLKGQEEESRI